MDHTATRMLRIELILLALACLAQPVAAAPPPVDSPLTKIDKQGEQLPAGANKWICAFDPTTGLTWEVKQEEGLHGARARYTYFDPADGWQIGHQRSKRAQCSLADKRCNTDAYITAVNAAGLCGHHDWRLPTVGELWTLRDFQRTQVVRAVIPSLSGLYWSSQLEPHYPGATYQALAVDFSPVVHEDWLLAKATSPGTPLAVMAVRGQRHD